MQRNAKPVAWRAHGLSDTLDSTNTFPGAMQSLQNLIPHPSTKALWQCRPASLLTTNFSTSQWTAPFGNVSLLRVIGNFAFGMVASNDFPGHDVPFVYNLLTNTFVTITGVVAGNVPTSPASSGAWTPPTGALIGSKLIFTHPGFSGTGTNFVGQLDISNISAPVWSTHQLTGAVTFTVPPIAVAQFNGRAYYIHNLISQPAVIFSDSLNATNVTNANQVLTFGDNVPLTALAGLPLNSTAGGIVQAMMVFKGVQNIYQITGDAATSNLSVNTLNVPTGTLAPNSIASTPKGLLFMAPDGVRMLDFYAVVSNPIGQDGQGVTVPFIYSVVPSRVAAACGGSVYRITTQNGNTPGSPQQEYWYDISRQLWSGPHTFPANLIQPFGNTFIMAPNAQPTQMWRSDVVQSGTSTFSENGQQMTWAWNTPLLPDTDQISNNAVTESSFDFQFSSSFALINVTFLTEQMIVVDTVNLLPLGGTSATIWGSFIWGSAPWGGSTAAFSPLQIPWHLPIVFSRAFFQATGQSGSGVICGALHLRLQPLRYIVNQGAAA